MAMEKLYELHESGKYDVLVLDTPPTRHALDFLDAPKKMMGFMDEGVLELFMTPSRMAGKLAEYRMPFGGFIVNRVHADALEEDGAKERWLRLRDRPAGILESLGVTGTLPLAERMAEHFDRVQALAETDAAGIAHLKKSCEGSHFWRTVPAFDLDLHDLSALARLNAYLFDR